ncbi:CUS1 [Cyberlindnera jadinii]|uniref:CUS1 protein n=1 Tax=Cyberlindnera jadinii (strain ATCC 18201 / CBS 1600 / BCRC 20928 / JCM 3617 / NBRC 0987 / NRRL Y-1542) TaxID=983966 RepID=A0A0H5C6G0_CYBJN|nr:DUF382-domain-containing protein [Cyberlindnera jadinii NRRL Y-1542]ODV73508.1 DUF382-domain-containing protein [Cyberlindnera jadinii NRRL Y-1542]CEP23608.1 CUS1 [Cyberlindnera jadinii]
MAKAHKSKNQLRRERLKQKKLEEQSASTDEKKDHDELNQGQKQSQRSSTRAHLEVIVDAPELSQFTDVFNKFHSVETSDGDESDTPRATNERGEILENSDDDDDDAGGAGGALTVTQDEEPQMSKRKLRKANKIPLSRLKATSKYPELVEWYDADATDPLLVVQLKCLKNSVPVPVNWQFKRDYLSGKRGFEKSAFKLPKFISDTGITDMRDTTKEDESSLKQRQRERVQPKMNRLDMDYQKLHDAFFKFQTKPRLYAFGDVFYEGKDMEESSHLDFRPGVISDELRSALGISKDGILPWVAKMSMYGPPPSYPYMKIPGYNVPLGDEGVVDNPLSACGDVELEPFGKVISYEEDEEEDEDDEDEEVEDESDNDVPGYVNDEGAVVVDQNDLAPSMDTLNDAEDEENDEDEDIPLSTLETRTTEKESIEPKNLYHILKEKMVSNNGVLSTKRAYDLGNENNDKTVKKPRSEAKHDTNEDGDEEDDNGKFKF